MNALVPVSHAPPMTVSDVERVALAIAKGGLFGSKDPNAVLTLCLLAQAEGQHPAVVFRDYHVINGKPAKKAEAMLRDFINAGGKVEWHTLTDDCADATFTHPSGSARIAWDHARAAKAQIAGNAMYKKYPRQMLRSRVISEGIRTVYPGATSGLYEEGEVASFTDPAPLAADTEGDGQDQRRGPINIEALGVRDEPLRRDPPIPGITKIRNNLNKLRREGGKICADDVGALEAFNALVHTYKDDLTKIKDAEHTLWTGMGEDFDGFKAWIKRRREEMAPREETATYQLLTSTLLLCETPAELQNWLNKNGEVVETLDGEESRKFEQTFNELEAGLKAVAVLNT